jgi:hypothetical protein
MGWLDTIINVLGSGLLSGGNGQPGILGGSAMAGGMIPAVKNKSAFDDPRIRFGINLMGTDRYSDKPVTFGQQMSEAYDKTFNQENEGLKNEYLKAQTDEAKMKANQLKLWQNMFGGGAQGVLGGEGAPSVPGATAQVNPGLDGVLSGNPQIDKLRPLLGMVGPDAGMKLIGDAFLTGKDRYITAGKKIYDISGGSPVRVDGSGQSMDGETNLDMMGTGFAGGTPKDYLYDEDNPIDVAQARADQTEARTLLTNLQKEVAQGSDNKATIAKMKAAQDAGVYTGPLAGTNNFFNKALSPFFDSARQRVTNYQTIDSGSSDLARQERQPGEGAISNFDASQFLKVVPGADKTPEFNNAAYAARAQAARLPSEKQEFLREFRRRNGNVVSADAAWNEYLEANPVINPSYDINDPATILNPGRVNWRQYFGAGSQQQAVDPASAGILIGDMPEGVLSGVQQTPAGQALTRQKPAGPPTPYEIQQEMKRRGLAPNG